MDPYTSSCDPPTIIERGDKFVDQTASPITRIQMQNSLDFFKLQNATVQYVGKVSLPFTESVIAAADVCVGGGGRVMNTEWNNYINKM